MRENDILRYSYALAKQLPSAYALKTSYGQFDLDDEMRAAVEAALRPILTARMQEAKGVIMDKRLQECSRTINSEMVDAGHAAAQAWYADILDRIDAVVQSEAIRQGREINSGYCVDSCLNKTFGAIPIAQRAAFLDAVGAYVVAFLAYGEPTREWRITADDLAMFASTPAEQDAWGDHRNEEEGGSIDG